MEHDQRGEQANQQGRSATAAIDGSQLKENNDGKSIATAAPTTTTQEKTVTAPTVTDDSLLLGLLSHHEVPPPSILFTELEMVASSLSRETGEGQKRVKRQREHPRGMCLEGIRPCRSPRRLLLTPPEIVAVAVAAAAAAAVADRLALVVFFLSCWMDCDGSSLGRYAIMKTKEHSSYLYKHSIESLGQIAKY
uniref:Uncharacterized protein n=1 Tax=Leersia perrieri TaxID=77586 RepID=A0A0D9X2B1_9ORYZ